MKKALLVFAGIVSVGIFFTTSVLAQPGHLLQLNAPGAPPSLITGSSSGGTYTLPNGGGSILVQQAGSPTVSNAWLHGGNTIGAPPTPGYGSIGTLDNVAMTFMTNGVTRMTISNTTGAVTINTIPTLSSSINLLTTNGGQIETRTVASLPIVGIGEPYITFQADLGSLSNNRVLASSNNSLSIAIGGLDNSNADVTLNLAHSNTWTADQLLPNSAAQGNNVMTAINTGSGTLNDLRLSANVPLKNATNTFSGINTFSAMPSGSSSTTLVVSNGGTLETRTAVSLAATTSWLLSGNAGTTPGTNFVGTTDNQAFQIHVDNGSTTGSDGRGEVLRFEPNATSANIVGGYQGNTVIVGTIGATISGGGRNGGLQSISANYSTVAGGNANLIETGATNGTISGGINHEIRTGSANATIAGGSNNEIQSGTSTISGGANNTISTTAGTSTIAGGSSNTINAGATTSTISGGSSNTIAASASNSTIAGGGGHIISSNTSFIGGGDNANIGLNSRWSAIAGGHNNKIADNSFESNIGAGEGNDVLLNSVRSTIGGGSFNDIGPNASNSTIAGGYGTSINDNADRSTIGGGISNIIKQGASISTIAGGFQNIIDTNANTGTIGGGSNNLIDNSSTNSVIDGGNGNTINVSSSNTVIGGGVVNTISASTSVIGGGSNNSIRLSAANGTIAGGTQNVIDTSASTAAIGGGSNNFIDNNSSNSVIVGGAGNTISASSGSSTILGGRGLTLSAVGNIGFLANNGGTFPMTIAATNVATLGNTDLWLANNDNSASALRFFEANNTTGAFPGTTNYSSFEAQAQTADIRYILPDTAGIVGDLLAVKSVAGTIVTLDWSAGFNNAWSLIGNAGTTAGTNFIGTTDDQPFQIHVDNANSTATNGRGRVMRYEPNATSANIIGGFKSNSVTVGVVGATISGGGSNGNVSSIASNYSTVGGGNRNTIGTSSINATISGGVANAVTTSAGNATIAGGLGNVITSGDHTTISGGFNNKIQTGAFGCSISGGTNNSLSSHTSTIGGGNGNVVGTSAQFSTINGGSNNFIGISSFESTIGGGVLDSVETSAPYSTIAGGNSNAIRSAASGSTIAGGRENKIGTSATNSTITGGRGLSLNGSGSFGFLGANTGSNDMSISATNTAVFGNTDLWLANNRNQPSELRFFEAYNTFGAFPNTAKYVGFKAPAAVITSVSYTLPDADGTSGQVLSTNGSGTLSWTSTGISYIGGNSGGNSANGTFMLISGSGSTAVENTAQIVITRTVTLQNLFVHLSGAPGAGTSKTVTIRRNGVNTTLAVTVANAGVNGNSGATTETFNVGDLLSVEIDHTAGPGASVVMIGFEMVM